MQLELGEVTLLAQRVDQVRVFGYDKLAFTANSQVRVMACSGGLPSEFCASPLQEAKSFDVHPQGVLLVTATQRSVVKYLLCYNKIARFAQLPIQAQIVRFTAGGEELVLLTQNKTSFSLLFYSTFGGRRLRHFDLQLPPLQILFYKNGLVQLAMEQSSEFLLGTARKRVAGSIVRFMEKYQLTVAVLRENRCYLQAEGGSSSADLGLDSEINALQVLQEAGLILVFTGSSFNLVKLRITYYEGRLQSLWLSFVAKVPLTVRVLRACFFPDCSSLILLTHDQQLFHACCRLRGEGGRELDWVAAFTGSRLKEYYVIEREQQSIQFERQIAIQEPLKMAELAILDTCIDEAKQRLAALLSTKMANRKLYYYKCDKLKERVALGREEAEQQLKKNNEALLKQRESLAKQFIALQAEHRRVVAEGRRVQSQCAKEVAESVRHAGSQFKSLLQRKGQNMQRLKQRTDQLQRFRRGYRQEMWKEGSWYKKKLKSDLEEQLGSMAMATTRFESENACVKDYSKTLQQSLRQLEQMTHCLASCSLEEQAPRDSGDLVAGARQLELRLGEHNQVELQLRNLNRRQTQLSELVSYSLAEMTQAVLEFSKKDDALSQAMEKAFAQLGSEIMRGSSLSRRLEQGEQDRRKAQQQLNEARLELTATKRTVDKLLFRLKASVDKKQYRKGAAMFIDEVRRCQDSKTSQAEGATRQSVRQSLEESHKVMRKYASLMSTTDRSNALAYAQTLRGQREVTGQLLGQVHYKRRELTSIKKYLHTVNGLVKRSSLQPMRRTSFH